MILLIKFFVKWPYKGTYRFFVTRCVFYSSHRADSLRLCATRPIKTGLRQHTPSLPCVRPYESLAIVTAKSVGPLVLHFRLIYYNIAFFIIGLKLTY